VKTCKADAKHQDSFLKEARVLTALDHPYIVKLYGVCTREDSDMFIITELMGNGDLRRFLLNDAGKAIHLPELMRFAVQVSFSS